MADVISPVNIESRKTLDLRAGDIVRVFQKIQEKGKTRLQVFEGMVIARKHGKEAGATFTVRRSTGGFGVEKIFPLYSPMIDKIEIIKRSKVRRSKLYFIRRKALKEISKRLKMMFVDITLHQTAPSADGAGQAPNQDGSGSEQVSEESQEVSPESGSQETPANQETEEPVTTPEENK